MKKQKSHSILLRILIPVLLVMILQMIIFFSFMFFGEIDSLLTTNAYNTFQNKINLRSRDLEYKILREWTNFDFPLQQINAKYEDFLTHKNITSLNTSSLEIEFLAIISQTLEGLLRSNRVNGAFIIMARDGDDTPNAVHRNGIALSDLDPDAGLKDNEDICIEIATYHIAKKIGNILSTNWQTYFSITPQSDFYFFPVQAAKTYPKVEAKKLGYWDFNHKMPQSNIPSISYSVPIRDKSGKTYAILGVEITNDYLATLLPFQELVDEAPASYALGLYREDYNKFDIPIFNGFLHYEVFRETKKLYLEPIKSSDFLFKIYNINSRDSFAGVKKLNIYKNISSYSNQNIALIGIVKKTDLLKFKSLIFKTLIITSIFALIIGFFGIIITTKFLSTPITKLAKMIRNFKPYTNTQIPYIGISEIDELIFSIENLNKQIKDSQLQISRIIELSGIPIQAFVFDYKDQSFFFTKNFFKIFIDYKIINSTFDTLNQYKNFLTQLTTCPHYQEDTNTTVYHLQESSVNDTFIRVTILETKDRIIGTVMDVTKEINQKRQIEEERDIDILVNLYNRRAFTKNMELLFNSNTNLQYGFLMMLDVDSLKYVNDTFGHFHGDRLIKKTANLLRPLQNNKTIVARLSGDEFVVFSYGFKTIAQMQNKINAISKSTKNIIITFPQVDNYKLSLSGGYALYPKHSSDFHLLLRYADVAMYSVKKNIKGRIVPYNKQNILIDQ